MRVVMVSKALVIGVYQRKAEEIARCGVDLTVLIPPSWRDSRGEQRAEQRFCRGYQLREIPIRRNGHFHTYSFPTLAQELQRLAPDILHMDEEPYNFATWRAVRSARRQDIKTLFFSWQNIDKRYPLPFGWFERENLRRADYAIAGNQAAAEILQHKGLAAPVAVIPQFGVDPQLFQPDPANQSRGHQPFTIGYAGGLLREKGIDTLIRACSRLQGDWALHLAGAGDDRTRLEALIAELNLGPRVHFVGRIAGDQMPDYFRALDLFVLPSRTTATWKEQFGRVLIEAMACGVPVIGSSSGEIPNVIGHAGLLFPEDDADALQVQIQRLVDSPQCCRAYGAAGRTRVLAHFTMEQIAHSTVEVYRRVCTSR